METYVKGPETPAEKIGYPNVVETPKNPEMEIYETGGGLDWWSILLGLLFIIVIGVGVFFACRTYLDNQIQIVKLQSEIKYNCLPKFQ